MDKISKIKPPNPPWMPIKEANNVGGYLAYYYSDDMSQLPVRAVTKIGDNKVDPNIETRTYGLFSKCGYQMRKSIIKRGCTHLFFFTNRSHTRMLTGYYAIRWKAEMPSAKDDYSVAAERAYFVESGIPLTEVDLRCETNTSRWFREFIFLNEQECQKMLKLLIGQQNIERQYVSEVKRLERFNLAQSGYRYVSSEWIESPSWYCSKALELLVR